MTPILILVFGYNPVTAIGTDLAYGAVTKTVGGWRHFKQRTVHFPLTVWMGVGSVPAAVGGVYVLHRLEHAYGSSFDNGLLIAVAAALMFTGLAVLARALFLPKLVGASAQRLRDDAPRQDQRRRCSACSSASSWAPHRPAAARSSRSG